MRKATLTNALTKGVLDPNLSERIDLNHYYNSLESGLNLEMTPQGGVKRRNGTTIGPRARRRLEPIFLTLGMFSSPLTSVNLASLIDNISTSFWAATTPSTGSLNSVLQVDLGAPKSVCFLDLVGFYCSSGGGSNRAIGVQYWTGSAWADFGAYKDTSSTERTRRFGGAPGYSVTAQLWRVVMKQNNAQIRITELRMFGEGSKVFNAYGFSFAKSSTDVFELVMTELNIDVYRSNTFVSAIPIHYFLNELPNVEMEQQLDTVFLYHESVKNVEIVRQGDIDEWNIRQITYANIPTLASVGGSFSGDTSEIVEVYFPNLQIGDTAVGFDEDGVSGTLRPYASATYSGNVVSFVSAATGISTFSIQALSGSVPGVQIIGYYNFRLKMVFTGASLCQPQVSVIQKGINLSNPVYGSINGYVRCGKIFAERHVVAGFRAAPSSWAFSRFGDPYNFLDTAAPLTADLAIFGTLNASDVQTIHKVFQGRSLHFLTEQAEWFLDTSIIDATQPISIKRATNNGVKADVPPVFADGGTLFIQRGGRVLRDLTYSDVELTYDADALSLLAPHLLTNVVDMAQSASRTTSEGNKVYMVNEAGDVAFLAFMRKQEVAAMCTWQFGGIVKSIFTDVQYRTWHLIERTTAGGQKDIYLERHDATHGLDGAVIYNGAATSIVTGLGHFEGLPVWAWADNRIVGPFTVTGGQVTLNQPASSIVCGRFPPVRGRLPRMRDKLANGYPFRTPGRVYELGLSLVDTGQISIAVNGGPFQNVPLSFTDDIALDIGNEGARDAAGLASQTNPDLDPSLPVLSRLFKGEKRVTRLRGVSRHPTVEFSQTIPAPLHIKAIRCEIVHS